MSNTKKPHAPKVSGYSNAGGSLTRRATRSFKPDSNSPSQDINQNNTTLRQRSRMLYMSSPVAASAINTNRTKVVGTGLTLKAAIDREVLGMTPEAAKAWQTKTEAEFLFWAGNRRNCDALGMNNFYGLQQLALKSWLMSGDVFAVVKRSQATALNPYSLRLHLIEADRISTPDTCGNVINKWANITEGKNTTNGNKIFDGVEVDANGLAVAYWVRNTYPREVTLEKTTWQRIEAVGKKTGLPNILHVMDCERPDQYRGVPYLAPVIEMLLQLRRYTESELMAALVQSFFTAWIVTKTDKTVIPANEVGGGDIAGVPAENPDESNVSHSENEYEMGPGSVFHLDEDEDIKFGSPNVPTAGFDTFVKTMGKMVGGALEEPYEILFKEFNSSYSASRGALLEAWEAYKMRRVWLQDGFCQPTYELWLSEAVALGRIKAPGFFDDPLIRAAWCGARWIGPVQGSLDPKKEVEAAILQVQNGYKTHEQVTREMGGGDWEENVEQLRRENELLQAAGINAVLGSANFNNEEENDDGQSENLGDGEQSYRRN